MLLPQVYYEATLLREEIYLPCSMEIDNNCRFYVYPRAIFFPWARGETGYVGVNNERRRVQLLEDEEILTALDTPSMAWLSENQVGGSASVGGLASKRSESESFWLICV